MAMIEQFRLYADYNRLMNARQYAAVAQLPDSELRGDRGAFFGSVLGTLNHLLVGDILWLKRFASHPASASALSPVIDMRKPVALNEILFDDLAMLRDHRVALDALIVAWLAGLTDGDLGDALAYESMSRGHFRKPLASLISHFFLHQVHHRGQITTLLSQAGVDFGETDLVEIIDDCPI